MEEDSPASTSLLISCLCNSIELTAHETSSNNKTLRKLLGAEPGLFQSGTLHMHVQAKGYPELEGDTPFHEPWTISADVTLMRPIKAWQKRTSLSLVSDTNASIFRVPPLEYLYSKCISKSKLQCIKILWKPKFQHRFSNLDDVNRLKATWPDSTLTMLTVLCTSFSRVCWKLLKFCKQCTCMFCNTKRFCSRFSGFCILKSWI